MNILLLLFPSTLLPETSTNSPRGEAKMKKAGVFLASVAAASSAALPPVASDNKSYSYSQKGFQKETKGKDKRSVMMREEASGERESFAPRFNGLRFIETLVTAHR